MKALIPTLMAALLLVPQWAFAKVDVVTLPSKDSTQITIYNSADLTLVREKRNLTLLEGKNQLQFSWAGTLIDPTSLDLNATTNAQDITVFDLSYPPGIKNTGIWNIDAKKAGSFPVEITYLTSGLSWQANYEAVLNADETMMDLEGFVRISNNSGEDYSNTSTRLIVGKVHMLDEIRDLASSPYPYGAPASMFMAGGTIGAVNDGVISCKGEKTKTMMARSMMESLAALPEPKEITKQGLSEYFLYTIPGDEDIENKWSKRLSSFTAKNIPVTNLYKFHPQRYGSHTIRFLKLVNDEKHNLGQTPIPGGNIRVYRSIDEQNHLSYQGVSQFQYIPVNEKAELNLGRARNVTVKSRKMKTETDNYKFDQHGNINGWDEITTYKITINNTRPIPVKLELIFDLPTTYWKVQNTGEYGTYTKYDADTMQYEMTVEAGAEKTFTSRITVFNGTRQTNN